MFVSRYSGGPETRAQCRNIYQRKLAAGACVTTGHSSSTPCDNSSLSRREARHGRREGRSAERGHQVREYTVKGSLVSRSTRVRSRKGNAVHMMVKVVLNGGHGGARAQSRVMEQWPVSCPKYRKAHRVPAQKWPSWFDREIRLFPTSGFLIRKVGF